MTRELQGIKRVTGIVVRAKLDKNKVGLPQRQAEFEITFGYGVDDLKACIAFLDQHKGLNGEKPAALLKALREPDNEALRASIRERVVQRWAEIETSFMPPSRKYDG